MYKNYILRKGSVAFLSLFIAFSAGAQQLKTVNGVISNGRVNSKNDIAAFESAHSNVAKKVKLGAKDYILLSFNHILTDNERRFVEAQGFDLLGWLPENTYIAASANAQLSLSKLRTATGSGVVLPNGVGEVPDELKLSKDIYYGVQLSQDIPHQVAKNGLAVSVHSDSDIPALKEALKEKNISFSVERYCGSNALVIKRRDIEAVKYVLALSYVSAIEPYAGDPQEEWSYKMFSNQTYAANYNTGTSIGNNTYFGNYETYGFSPFFDFNFTGRQHPQYSDNSDNGHGTNCAEIVGATNNHNEYEDRGMAPGVTAMYLGWYNTVENMYNNNNIRPLTSNHSVGWSAGSVTYNNDAREMDRIARQLGGYLHSYSAGNSGSSGPFNGYPAGWANLTGNIKTYKNHFTTHSAADLGSHHDWTNKGPTADGRLKPDICAEGGEGSSYASPGVMGLCNILYETYTNTYGTSPRSDVVKAVILNTAVDLDKKGIDFKTGFGVINPVRAHRSIAQQHVFTGSMPSGSTGSSTFTLNVGAGLREARILLYWHDYQGTVGASKALVNDLDIIVLKPNGDTVRPWVLKPTSSTVYDLPTQIRDTLNNVEQVTIDNPPSGNYTIIVQGPVVPQGPQTFVVTYDLLPYMVEVTSPVANFRTGRGKDIYFTWNLANNQTNAADSMQVFLQRQSTESFTQIASLPNNALFYEYAVPTAFPLSSTARIIVKQKNTTLVDTSDYFHVMLTPDSLGFKKICSDTLTLRWDTVANQGGKYIIYRLGQKYMYPIDSVMHPVDFKALSSVAVLGIGQQWGATEWFAVAARHSNGALSLRTLPVTQDGSNPLNAPSWMQASDYTLCFGDTVNLNTGWLSGDSIRWFKNNVLMTNGNTPTIQVTYNDVGIYHYNVYNGTCTYTSADITVNSGGVDINDTAVWGNYKWNISCYNGIGYSTPPYYGTNPKYYGKFKVNNLSFNSNDYYAWSGSGPHNAPGYEGCPFTAANATTTVWKRKGFVPGNYQINILRASGKMRITVFNGTTTAYVSPTNAFTVNNVWNGFLDSNSTIRVEHYGSHARIDIIPQFSIGPGNITTDLAIWNKADMSHGDNNGIHTLVNAFPKGGAADKITTSTILWNPAGRNYNGTLVFNSSGGFNGAFQGISDSLYSGNDVSSFGVFNVAGASAANARVMSLAGETAQDDNTDESFIPFKRDGSSTAIELYRDGVTLTQANLLTDNWLLMRSKYEGNNSEVMYKAGATNSAAYTATPFNLKRYAVGGYLDQTTGGNMSGEIAELIHFNRSLTAIEESKINSYLAIKYGITLAQNYVNTAGQIVYDTTGYPDNIAGIAREDVEAFNQKQSHSEELVQDVFAGSLGNIVLNNLSNTNTFNANNVYAVWGHNGADTAFNSIITSNNQPRMDRVWKLMKTGSVGTMRFNFKESAVPGVTLNGCTEYFLVMSDDASFTSVNTTFTAMDVYMGGDNIPYGYADINLSAGGNATYYFTVSKDARDIKALATSSVINTLITCYSGDTISLIDNADDKMVAKIFKNTGNALPTITAVNYETNRTDAQLANCNTTQSMSLLNRILQIDATLPAGNTVNLRLYMLAADSVNAMNNTWLTANSCPALNPDVLWYKEANTADVMSKLAGLQNMNYYSNVLYGTENGIAYIEYQGLNSFSSFGGVLQSTPVSVAGKTITGLQVYPNPTTGSFVVDLPSTGDCEILVTDVTGKVVEKRELPANNIRQQYFSLKQQAKGIYFVKVKINGISHQVKVTVQ